MRAKGINSMSTRRAVRPDAMVYRQTRRLTRRKRSLIWWEVLAAVIVTIVPLLVVWIRHRHH